MVNFDEGSKDPYWRSVRPATAFGPIAGFRSCFDFGADKKQSGQCSNGRLIPEARRDY
ncbi:hypothetical protein FHX14_002561 [Rhizobium sp. BK619]|uniref:hypothetical protein n=1 Tax=Rhizobium sp. BK619 TaxID=2586989 RepID=UPI00160C2936|nr:hypothetical protein [Rhizobium sp. BK619]MBB3646364.1 hypothetical protein [Rhizobium sp. BK619]